MAGQPACISDLQDEELAFILTLLRPPRLAGDQQRERAEWMQEGGGQGWRGRQRGAEKAGKIKGGRGWGGGGGK